MVFKQTLICIVGPLWYATLQDYDECRHVATVKSRFQFFSQKYDVEFHNGQQDLVMKGNWGAYDFSIQRGNSTVGHVSKKFFTCADNYGLEVQPGEDVVVMMACVAIIDRCCHDSE